MAISGAIARRSGHGPSRLLGGPCADQYYVKFMGRARLLGSYALLASLVTGSILGAVDGTASRRPGHRWIPSSFPNLPGAARTPPRPMNGEPPLSPRHWIMGRFELKE